MSNREPGRKRKRKGVEGGAFLTGLGHIYYKNKNALQL